MFDKDEVVGVVTTLLPVYILIMISWIVTGIVVILTVIFTKNLWSLFLFCLPVITTFLGFLHIEEMSGK